MKIIYNRVFLEHDTGMHPENKKRLEACGDLAETEVENGEKYLELFHTKEYIDHVKLASSKSSGFCIFNNLAIAVQRLVNEGKKVFIFDFDAHLGDGTVKFFYDSDRVLYWSLHQFPAFPGGGNVSEIGVGKGKGYTINVPLPPGSGDEIFMNAVERFMPAAEQFKPDVVAVSAGFDAHQFDLLLDLRLSMNTYYKIGKFLSERFENIFATLEGGYNVEVFSKCLYNFIDGINGESMSFNEQTTDSRIIAIDEYEARAYQVEKNLSEFWRL